MTIPGKPKQMRGFAKMDPKRQREIAQMGGRAAHEKGTGHEWTSAEASIAGKKGGHASARTRSITQSLGK